MSDDLQRLKELEKASAENEKKDRPQVIIDEGQPLRPRRRHRPRERPSLFGPILLVGVGLYFLLSNLNVIDGALHWDALFQFWPVFLIFLGVNIIVRQLPGRLGTAASGALGLTAVALAGTVLLFADRLPFVQDYAGSGGSLTTYTISRPLNDAQTAFVSIEGSSQPLELEVLNDSRNLVEGTIHTNGRLIEDFQPAEDAVRYDLEVRSTGFSSGFGFGDDSRWELALTDRVPLDLTLNLGSGPGDIDLADLQLVDLFVDSGSGPLTMSLPPGSYGATLDFGSGPVSVRLPDSGRISLRIDGGSGPIRLVLPDGVEGRVEVDRGSGPFNADPRFSLVSGETRGDGVWETDGFGQNPDHFFTIEIDGGSGPISISGG